MAAGSGETHRRRTGRLWGRGPLHHGQGTTPYKGAAASSCTPANSEAGATPQTSTGACDRGRAGNGPVGKGRTQPSANPEAPRRGPDPEGGLSARNAWGRSGPRLACAPEAVARAAQTRRRRGARRRVAARRGTERPIHCTVP
jgi:hypothetical protein